MNSSVEGAAIQRIQTAHRLKLAEFWGVGKGQRILEIGCGQGDTTAVLAYLTGETGLVHGIDIASPDYGSPSTLGEAAERLKQSPLGERIRIDFETDPSSPDVRFSDHSFDCVVLSHCSWYFQSAEQLADVFKRAREWGNKLLFAEWDARIAHPEQYPHLLAVLIQAQYEAWKKESISNVRTLFTPNQLRALAEAAGWTVVAEDSVYSPQLQDGEWEVAYTLQQHRAELTAIERLPSRLTTLMEAEIELLDAAQRQHGIKPLSSYVFKAE
ncbi:class I SAM-dependent methyltransferase [Paenibacillus hodogayensis]|uniref:Class I SAM-dependent methyltransferase n=1 Tax=Paenibacillus hodogayensis TaxID=279208 RepID=A0ABV5W2X0_9BACL